MGVFIAAILVAFIPALLYILLFRLLDVYEKEPLWMIWSAFAWGAIPAVIFALIGEILGAGIFAEMFASDPVQVEFVTASVFAPFFEEIGKGAFLAIFFIIFRRQIDSPLDGLVVGATVGLGFAATENVFYLLGSFGDLGVAGFAITGFMRIVLLGFGHALFTGATGLGFAYVRLGRGAWKVFAPILGLLSGMALHAIWNGTLVLGRSGLAVLIVLALHWLVVIGMFVFVGLVLARERRWIEAELNEEVGHGLVTVDEVRRTCSVWGRFGTEIGALFTAGAGSLRAKERFYRDLSALALCKHNFRRRNDDRKAPAEIQAIRARIPEARSRAFPAPTY